MTAGVQTLGHGRVQRVCATVLVLLATAVPAGWAAPTTPTPTPATAGPASPSVPRTTRLVDVRATPARAQAGRTLRVTGRLLDQQGTPVVMAQVGVTALGPRGSADAVETGPQGGFTLQVHVPVGTAPGPQRVTVHFDGDTGLTRSSTALPLAVVPGGAALPTPTVAASSPVAGSDGPAPGATRIVPPTPAATPTAAPAPQRPEALPGWLLAALGALGALGALVGLGVASRQVMDPEDDEHYDRFIG